MKPEGGEPEANVHVIENLRQIHQREVKQLKDNLLRARADLDNFRKRSIKEKREMAKFANENLVSFLLPVLDNFSHATKAKEDPGDVKSYIEGVKLIYDQFLRILQDSGLKIIEAQNKPFDPRIHEAMMTKYQEKIPENRVLEVLREGYLYKDRVIRPAMVCVNKKPQEDQESDIKPEHEAKIQPESPDQGNKKKNEN